MNLVVDCSYIMSTILPEEENKFVELSQYNIYVPSIFFLECTNVLVTALKRKRIDNSAYDSYIDLLRKLPVTVDKFSSSADSLHFVSKLSKDHNLTAYDASYLELAIRYRASIATYDKSLQNACIHSSVVLV